MKILLLNQVFYPDVVSTAQHLADLAAALAAKGHEVTVISSRRAYEHPEKVFSARENWRGVNIVRVYSTHFGKSAKWRRVMDFASFLGFCSLRLLWMPRADVVLALTTPPLISFLGACRAKLWRARFCYWVMDFNPDEAIAAGWLKANTLAARWLDRMSRFSLGQADSIIALDRFMRDRIIAKNIPAEKIMVMPPWSQEEQVGFNLDGRETFRSQHGLQDKFVIMYSGNHSPVHPLNTLMQAADKLRSEKDIIFCFIGGGSEFQKIKKWAKNNPQVKCLPYQPLDKLSASLSAADAHVVVMGDAMLGLVHPCKIYNILTVAAPVIYLGPAPSHVSEILAELKGKHPWVGVRHGAVDDLVEGIRQLHKNKASHERKPPGEVVWNFSQSALLPCLVKELEKVSAAPVDSTGGASPISEITPGSASAGGDRQ